MNLALTAAIFYAVVMLYLVTRRVPVKSLLMIAGAGLFGGVVLAYTLGLAYFLIVVHRPVETIAVFSMASLLFIASYFARAHILGTITPLGIVFLNTAANFASGVGPLPLSFSWLANRIPLFAEPVRMVLSALVLYAPALIALAALRKGPPGNPMVRLLLGVWVCWVGIATFAGPGWKALSQFDFNRPLQWLVSVAAAWAAVHVMMLTLNLFSAVAADADDSARSIARSVRIDSMRPVHALLLGAAFWIGLYLFMRLPMPYEQKATLSIGTAFALAAMLDWLSPQSTVMRHELPSDATPAGQPAAFRFSSLMRLSLLYLAVLGTLAVFAWQQQADRRPAWAAGEPFSETDRFVELLLLASGGVSVLIAAAFGCMLFQGLTHRRARRWVVLPAMLALFVATRMTATPLSPLYEPESAQVAARYKQERWFGINMVDARKTRALKERLTQAGLPFTIVPGVGDTEFFRIPDEHRVAVEKITDDILRHPQTGDEDQDRQ